jgi:hypothetical protein
MARKPIGTRGGSVMKKSTVFILFLGVALLAGCASTNVTARRGYTAGERLPRPGRIIVYRFAATPGEVPSDAAISGSYERRSKPQSSKEVRLGRTLGASVATELVNHILKMGMPAELAGKRPSPREGDLLIQGEFVKIDEGSRLKRMVIGFGAGSGELKTHVETYQITGGKPRLLFGKKTRATGGRMPGMMVPVGVGAAAGRAGPSAAVSGGLNVAQEIGPESLRSMAKQTAKEIAKVLSQDFARQGWISSGKAK